MAAVFAAWAGWHFLHHRGQLEAGGQGNLPAEATGPSTRIDAIHNVLLVSIDTCRADHLSCYGYKRPTTPNIDAVAHDGAMFKMALTPVPLTTPAHSSMLTGTYPPTHGVHLNSYCEHLADSNVTLAKTLRDAGYQTAAFVGGFTLDARFGLNQGFDTYDGHFDESGRKGLDEKRDAEEVARPALAWLEEHAKRPFFLFLHFYDAHIPYVPHLPYTLPDAPYDGEIAYIDHCIGRVLDRLRALGVYDNTLLIITGDHGEGLGEHSEMKHGYFIYQSTLHVPLVVRAPRCGRGIQVDGNVSLVDIVPTVLDLVGLQTPARVEGVDLRPALEGAPAPERRQPVYAESLDAATFGCSPLHGIVEGGWKYILAPRPELYDLSQDPGERTDLIGKEPQLARRLRGRLEAMLKELETAAPPRVASSVDAEAIKRLESLGYVGGGATPPASILDTTREDPKDFLSVYQRIDKAMTLFFADHRSEKARKELLEIAESRPELIMAHQLLGDIAMDEQRLADAAGHYAKVAAMLGEAKDPSRQPPGVMEGLATAHNSLGSALARRGQIDEAIAHFRKASEIKPDYAEAHNNLGSALAGRERLDEAVAHFQKALEIKPDYASAHCNLGLALAHRGQLDEAVTHFQKALEIKPDSVEAHSNLGIVLAGRGRLDETIAHFQKALEVKPDDVDARQNLEVARSEREKIVTALVQRREMLRSRPKDVSLLKDTAWLLATSPSASARNGAEAVELAQQAVLLTGGKDPAALDILAAAYAEGGRFAEAIQTDRKALDLANEQTKQSLAEAIQSRLKLYQANSPFRAAIRPPPTRQP